MSKAIYCLKIFLFRDEFQLTDEERRGISDVCIFITTTYVVAWFSTPLAIEAPSQDLTFFKKLFEYRMVDPDISYAAVNKFRNHLWYLSPQAAAFSFFDLKLLSVETKIRMIKALNHDLYKKELNNSFAPKLRIFLQDLT